MGRRFAEIAFTPSVQQVQHAFGSHGLAARLAQRPDAGDILGPDEAAFIAARDSFYLASVGETGWPYVQHRGGPPGFLRVLDERSIGFADFVGNRQYVSAGNLAANDRVALILVDYPNRARLKILGHARLLDRDADAGLLERLAVPGYRARIDRGVLIALAAFDWNCPQHITPRWTAAEIAPALEQLRGRIAALEAELARARQPEAAG